MGDFSTCSRRSSIPRAQTDFDPPALKMPALHRSLVLVLSLFFAAIPVEARTVRVASFNIENGPDAPGTSDYNATKAIVQRINADIVAFQEVRRSSTNQWRQMGLELGYSNIQLGTTDSAGALLGFFSRYPLQATNLSSAPPANEFTRRPMRAVVQVPGASKPLVIWTMHHKADDFTPANTPANQFRRAIEAQRIVQDINSYRANNPTHTEFLMLGDLNENMFGTNSTTLGQIDTSAQTVQFSQTDYDSFRGNTDVFSDGYRLGSDITFPVPYRSFPDGRYALAGLNRLNLRQQNGQWTGTRGGRYVALDYILLSSALTTRAVGEIYNSTLDASHVGLPKVGAPLAANTSDLASDHYAVFADIQLQGGASSFTVLPDSEVWTTGPSGGPFTPGSTTYTVSNPGTQSLSFSITSDASWLVPQAGSVTVPAGGSANFSVSIDASAAPTSPGEYVGRITLGGSGEVRTVRLVVLSPVTDHFAQQFSVSAPFNLTNRTVTFTPDGSANFYSATIAAAAAFPTSPDGGAVLSNFASPDSREIAVDGGKSIPFFGLGYTRFFVGSAGYITFTGQDYDYSPSLTDHFSQPRISGLFFDLEPKTGAVSCKQLPDRVAVTFQNVAQYGAGGSNNFQIEMFFDGRIRLTWLGIGAATPALGATHPLVGLSSGGGRPPRYRWQEFQGYVSTPTSSIFDDFVLGYGLDPSGPGASGADPDNDGISNWAEFAFGGSPVLGDATLLQVQNVAGQFVFTFLGRGEGFAYSVEKTSDLGAGFVLDGGLTPAAASDQTGVPAGWLRRQFAVPSTPPAFYRIQAVDN